MKRLFYLFVAVGILSGCGINSSIMLKTDPYYVFDDFPEKAQTEYQISPNDIIQFQMFKMNAVSLVDVTASISQENRRNGQQDINFLIELDGYCKLPVLGKTMLAGLTIREAEEKLEKLYGKYYKETYVQVTVLNRRVIVFPGSGGSARVINLENENTTLFEALALAGGISDRGKAKKVKLIRSEGMQRKVFLIDLAEIEGLDKGDIVLQANDIIYVEPRPEIAQEVLADIAPILSLFTSALFIISVLQNINP